MVTTLSGGNSYALQSELQKLVSEFVATHSDIAVERLEGKEADFDRIRESLQSTPFLASRKLVVLRNPSDNKIFVNQAEQLLKELPESTDVILVEPILDKRLSYYKLLKKATIFHEFTEPDQSGLERWLNETIQKGGGSINPSEARFLVERVGINQQRLAHELDKLLLYDPKITHDTIMLLTDPTPQSTIFDLLDTAFNGNSKRTLELYRDQREQKVDMSQIIAMLTWQLRIIALIKTAAGRTFENIIKEAKLNPYTVRKSQTAASRITFDQLKKLITDLLLIDMRSKRENIDLDEALQLFLLNIASSKA